MEEAEAVPKPIVCDVADKPLEQTSIFREVSAKPKYKGLEGYFKMRFGPGVIPEGNVTLPGR